jgi:HK97 family phage major capsid protein
MHPSTWAALSKLTTGSDDQRPVLNPQPTGVTTRSLLGVPIEVSRYCPEDTAYVADPSRLVVVDRVPASVEVDRSVKFLSDGVAVRAIMRLEFAAPYPTTIAKITTA